MCDKALSLQGATSPHFKHYIKAKIMGYCSYIFWGWLFSRLGFFVVGMEFLFSLF